MLFQRHIAFSGTPSSLLPLEMGECAFQMGDDAKMLKVALRKIMAESDCELDLHLAEAVLAAAL